MHDKLQFKPRRSTALIVFMLGALCCAHVINASWAKDNSIPLPERKPLLKEASIDQDTKNAGVIDFTKTLLSIKKSEQDTAIPLPLKKPEGEAKTTKIKTSIDPLDDKDVELYKEIFALQESGKIKKADQKIAKLSDNRLLGHVLFQRYMHPTAYTSSYAELESWLGKYGDHPGAHKIHALALKKQGAIKDANLGDVTEKIHFIRRGEPTMHRARTYTSPRKRSDKTIDEINILEKNIEALIRSDRPTQALGVLEEGQIANLLDTIEFDIIRARIAASYLYNAKLESAYLLASKSAARSGLHVPLAGWVAGLSSWIREDYDNAARHFEMVGRSSYASGWTKAAGAYWAARSHMRRGDVKAVSIWLNRAASSSRTFYGLIATRALGRDFDFNWKIPTFTRENYRILSAIPAGNRAIALVDTGQNALAEAELIRVDADNKDMRNALLAYAGYARLPGLAMRLGSNLSTTQEGRYFDAALYPVGPWQPEGGYKIDASLIHAIIRQESRFDPEAESPSGALGLMQLMPRTAEYLNRDAAQKLDDPEINLELGQTYLTKLLNERAVKDDLFRLLIAYNAGPGNLNKWNRRWPNIDDPLLFVELVPLAETRAYVERVLANYWIYRLRDRAPTPTLDAVTAGKSAKYAALAK